MHLLVTDNLSCARCGPAFGLVLAADELRNRRVLEGSLGCPNCRELYPVRAGFADLRPRPADPIEALGGSGAHEPPVPDEPETALRLAALLDVGSGPGLILIMGPAVGVAPRLAEIFTGVEVIAVHPALLEVEEREGVSRIDVGSELPFQDAGLRGVVLEGKVGRSLLSSALRCLSRGSRLVYLHPPSGVARELESRGVQILMEGEATVVCVRS